MSENRPALTPEEWAEKRAVREGRSPVVDIEIDEASFGELRPDGIHALAALCLHDQPFGFTWSDVDLLRREWENEWSGVPAPTDGDGLLDLAGRIARLLPPRPEET